MPVVNLAVAGYGAVTVNSYVAEGEIYRFIHKWNEAADRRGVLRGKPNPDLVYGVFGDLIEWPEICYPTFKYHGVHRSMLIRRRPYARVDTAARFRYRIHGIL